MKAKSKKNKSKNKIITPEITADFYVVSPKKFLIMFFGTMGLYAWYWFYKQWANYKIASGDNIWPVVRAFFSFFFAPILFKNIASKESNQTEGLIKLVNLIGTIFVFSYVAGKAGDRLAAMNIGAPFTIFMSIMLMPVIGWCLYQAQLIVNRVCNDAKGESNDKISLHNYLWLVLGLCYWIFTVLFLRYQFLSEYV